MNRKSIPLPNRIWKRLEAIAADTGSVAQKGPTIGRPSWRTLLRRIGEDEALLALIVRYLNSGGEMTRAHAIPGQMLRPQEPVTETVAWVSVVGNTIKIDFPEKHEDFREIVKGLGCTWEPIYWARKVDEFAISDRAAELCHELLAGGFSVVAPNEIVKEMTISGDFEPECRRWIMAAKGDYRGWFKIWWARSEDCYDAAIKITGSKYDKPCVVAPPEHYEEVVDFAEMYDFHFDGQALALLEQARDFRASAIVVDVSKVERPGPQTGIPELTIPEEIGIDDDLADDL